LANFAKSITGGENVSKEINININEWIYCDANDPGLERLTYEQILNGVLGTVLESEEENDEKQCAVKQVSHEITLKYIDKLIQYLKEQDDKTLYDKMLMKKTSIMSYKKVF
jgi:hypothetical protein